MMRDFKFLCLVLLFTLVWSSAFIVGKVAMRYFDPFSMLTVRFAICSLILLPFCLGRRLALFQRGLVGTGFILGVINNVLYLGMTFSSLYYIPPGWVVIIAACSPFMTGALAVLFRLERITAAKLLGIFIAFCGVVVMTGVGGMSDDTLTGLALAFGGTLAFSCGTVFFRGKSSGLPISALNFWLSVFGALLLAPAAIYAGHAEKLILQPFPPPGPLLALAWLVVITLAGMWLWFALIRMRGAATAASYHLLNPVSGLLLSFIILGAPIRPQDLAGALLIGLGLLISTYGRRLLTVFKR